MEVIEIDFISDVLLNLKPYKELINGINSNINEIATHGITDSALGHLVYSVENHVNKPIVFVTYDELRAKKYFEDIKNLGTNNVFFYPKRDVFFFDREAKSMDNTNTRLRAINAIVENENPIIITTFQALQDKIINRKIYSEKIIEINQVDEIDLEEVSLNLIEMGYERVLQVEGRGQFSIRGGIIDIFSIEEYPYRIELFDVEVDSIRSFDPITQRSMETLDKVKIQPVRDILILDLFKKEVAQILEKKIKSKKIKDEKIKERLEEKFGKYIENLKSEGYISNTDLMIPFIPSEYLSGLLDFFNEETLIFLDEPRKIDESILDSTFNFSEKLSDLIEHGEVIKEHEEVIFSEEEIRENLKESILVLLNSIISSFKGYSPKLICNFQMKSVTNYKGRIKLFKEDINQYLYRGYKIAILGGNEEKSNRIYKNLLDMGLQASYKEDRDFNIKSNEIIVIPGSINSGFEYSDIKFVLINYNEIYGTYQDKKKKSKKKDKGLNFSDLKPGDYVVHESHGIGQYMGTEQLEIQGIKKDYVNIAYRGEDKLFLPIEQLSFIHKYIGDEKPKVNKLNSVEWHKTKAKAKKAVEEMAEDLIQLYAKRASAVGYEFSKDTEWQSEFEDSFPFEETDGQIQSIQEIKKDMESNKPMDRLLCADVGYGKTEVALRAAFKAIMDGKQVAFLVPTTILAQQHYNTMVERFADFPVEIAMLSRFRSAKEQKNDLANLKKGMVDIVIGTHRLLSKDVVFKDLGLLIIDEEQRFGVRHKENLKLLKENIDTITLTATPIPRTLQMSMIGIRDMSVIDEPPEERFPVQTYVVEYNDMIVRDAIIREISRGGQVYFVYNRVSNMEQKLSELKKLVPEATFAMANGQMNERVLEDTMIKFFNHEVDVLICSTIIETGMDVTDANTMIITESNRLGLSQLYQLKGRIGRSNKIAYAYFTYEKNVAISEISEKRLKAIKEFTEFGSGYKIAMRDLEIRGSGNILGNRQHGHIDSIGYDLYIKYLKESVKKIKDNIEEEELETTFDIKIEGYIPSKYIEDEEQKLEIYKKISLLENVEDYMDLIDELIDRFGEVPYEVTNLMEVSLMRYEASKLGIKSVNEKNNQCEIVFSENFDFSLALINEITDKFKKKFKYSLKPEKSITLIKYGDLLNEIKDLFKIIKLHKNHTQN